MHPSSSERQEDGRKNILRKLKQKKFKKLSKRIVHLPDEIEKFDRNPNPSIGKDNFGIWKRKRANILVLRVLKFRGKGFVLKLLS